MDIRLLFCAVLVLLPNPFSVVKESMYHEGRYGREGQPVSHSKGSASQMLAYDHR